MKRVLITGAGSYIGDSFAAYAADRYPALRTETVGMRDGKWREMSFSGFDTILHVAGIAHADTGRATAEERAAYYAVNTDLAVETAKKAESEGVRQFVFMSSMIVYGDAAPVGRERVIDAMTQPAPASFYGDSKWQADQAIRGLASDHFAVAVLRPPMVYGRGSKGNFPSLVRLADRLPVFPAIGNRRSMLYIGNLCEFLCLLIDSGRGGVFFPQNAEYSGTAEVVRMIGEARGKKIRLSRLLDPAVRLFSRVPGRIGALTGKAFGNFIYSREISVYDGWNYQLYDLRRSIEETCGAK